MIEVCEYVSVDCLNSSVAFSRCSLTVYYSGISSQGGASCLSTTVAFSRCSLSVYYSGISSQAKLEDTRTLK